MKKFISAVNSKSKLTKVAQEFTNPRLIKTKLPKKIAKIVDLEKKLNKKIASEERKYASACGQITLKTATGNIPACYVVCGACRGVGKSPVNGERNFGIKFADSKSFLKAFSTKKCTYCKGEKLLKIADSEKCTEEQISERSDYETSKADEKAKKKAAKKEKKALKAAKKAEKARMAYEEPDKYAEIKAGKKAAKKQKKAQKKMEKAKKKAEKKIAKAQAAQV